MKSKNQDETFLTEPTSLEMFATIWKYLSFQLPRAVAREHCCGSKKGVHSRKDCKLNDGTRWLCQLLQELALTHD